MNFFEELKWRGFIKDCSNENLFQEYLNKKSAIYIGFDPTGKSLHLGHLLPINLLKHFENKGHQVIAVVGGATALIGDPKQQSERNLLSLEEVSENVIQIKKQLLNFLDFTNNKAVIENNYNWLKEINLIEFLRDYGKNFTVNYMLAKDIIASRLEVGISYTEFSYLVLQSIDFHTLYKKYNCRIQFGGSDQWGNITSGIELIRKSEGVEVCGATIPLLTSSSGLKFGKSEGNALYLDKELTTPYKIYQYFLNSADLDAVKYLKLFTFLSVEEINRIEKEMLIRPETRIAQKTLAYEVVKLIHSELEAINAKKMSEMLFSGNFNELTVEELLICFDGVPSKEIVENINIIDALIEVGAASSKREAREFVSNNSININGEVINDLNYNFKKENAIEKSLFILKRGKKLYFLLKLN